MEIVKTDLVVREAIEEDKRDIWIWWNNPLTRQMMKDNDVVPWDKHSMWFDNMLNDKQRIMCVGLYNEKKIGNIRFDNMLEDNGVFDVSINLNPIFRGQGVGALFLSETIDFLLNIRKPKKLFAIMKKTNIASRRIFEKSGFVVKEPIVSYDRMAGRYDFITENYCELLK